MNKITSIHDKKYSKYEEKPFGNHQFHGNNCENDGHPLRNHCSIMDTFRSMMTTIKISCNVEGIYISADVIKIIKR